VDKRTQDGKDLRISFDHTIVSDGSTGESWLVDSPKYVFRGQYSQPVFDNEARIGAEDIYISKRLTLQSGMPDAAAYDLVNINLSSTKIFPGAEASFGVYNLLNYKPQMVGGTGSTNDIPENVIPMNGRTVQAKLQYTY